MSKISRDVKKLARELNVPIIAGCQMNRAVDSRPDKRPFLSDLRESGSIEQDADNVLMLHRESAYEFDAESNASEITEIYVRKHRQGELGKAELMFNKASCEFLPVDRSHAERGVAG